MITIKDIARELGISVSTVGRALTDHPRISRETKERVREVAERRSYVANTAARIMRGGSSHLISLLLPDIRSEFYSMVAHIVSTALAREGYYVTLSITDEDPNRELQQLRELMSARVAGVVIVPSANPRVETVEMLSRLPHVQLLRRDPSLGDWFGIDDKRAIAEATDHLIGLGHKRIAYVGDNIFSTGRARLEGFRRAMAGAGCAIDDRLTLLGPPEPKFGSEAVDTLIRGRPQATAIISGAVIVTLGIAERLSARHLRIPEDISVVGFGDGPWQRWWGPGLTTLKLPVEEITIGCVLQLLHRLKTGMQQDEAPHGAISPSTLVVRQSTAPPRRARVVQ